MSVRFFRWTFIVLIAAFWGLMFISGDHTIGSSVEITNGDYRFAAGTRPQYLAISLFIAIAYIALMNAAAPVSTDPLPGVARRLVAAVLDFMLAVMVMASIIGTVPVLAEWKRTGEFAWIIERSTPGPDDDLISILGAALSLILTFVYFLVPLLRRRPSPGSCVLGYQIIPDPGRSVGVPEAVIRVFLGAVALGSWPLTPFISRERSRGKIWVDCVCKTRAVKL
jgi:uncharacterized RDD family membrane protein YckC